MLILFNKPYNVLCQFTDPENRKTLGDYIPIKNVYAAGRLDRDSEGLIVLTDSGKQQNLISNPKHKLSKTYWVQIEGIAETDNLKKLCTGIQLNDGKAQAKTARLITQPENLWHREPPIRERQTIPTSWLEITLTEGRNHQVRRMTAAIGHPTLRLIRYRIGDWILGNLLPGEWQTLN